MNLGEKKTEVLISTACLHICAFLFLFRKQELSIRELVSTVRLPAEAEAFVTSTIAEGKKARTLRNAQVSLALCQREEVSRYFDEYFREQPSESDSLEQLRRQLLRPEDEQRQLSSNLMIS